LISIFYQAGHTDAYRAEWVPNQSTPGYIWFHRFAYIRYPSASGLSCS
jgi:hypothetical protein